MTKASSEASFTLSVNARHAITQINDLRRSIRTTRQEWKNNVRTAKASGDMDEAMSAKQRGLRKELKQTNEVQKQTAYWMNKIANNDGKSSHPYNSLENHSRRYVVNQKKINTQLRSADKYLAVHTNALREDTKTIVGNRKITNAQIAEAKQQGDQYAENMVRANGYSNSLKALNKEKRDLITANNNLVKYSRNHKADPDTKDLQRFIDEKMAINEKSRVAMSKKYSDVDSGAFQNRQNLHSDVTANNLYNQSTEQVVSALSRLQGKAQASAVELQRLKSVRGNEGKALDEQRQQLNSVAQSVDSKLDPAYQRELHHLTSLSAQYDLHGQKINTIKKRYGTMTASMAKSVDAQEQKMVQLDTKSHNYLQTAHSLTNVSIALGAGFIYGAHQANLLQNEFTRITNLAETSGEKTAEVHRNIRKMADDTSNLSMRYGVSQETISKGYEALIRRGYSTNQALASQKSYLQGAIASGDDYSDVLDTAGSALESFGMRSNNTKKMVRNTKTAVNQLAYWADATATDFKGMGYAMKMTGATAHSAHQSLAETASAIGVLSNNGQDATNAGFGLRKVLNSFIGMKDEAKWKKILPKLGLSQKDFTDTKGNFKSLSDMMAILNDKTKNMSSAQRTDVFHQLFGATGQESAIILANNTKQVKKLNKQVSNSQKQNHGKGYISSIAKKNMTSVTMQLNRLKQAGNALAQDYGKGLAPVFYELAGAGMKLANTFKKMPQGIKTTLSIGTAVIPLVTGLLYLSSAIKKIHVGFIKTKMWMLGINDKAVASNSNENSALARLTETMDEATASIERLTKAKQGYTASTKQASEADAQEADESNAEVGLSNKDIGTKTTDTAREAEMSTAKPSLLSRANRLTGGAIGSGHMMSSFKRYAGTSSIMGLLAGSTEYANGDKAGGVEDGLGATVGGTLGGVSLGPVGSMAGSIIAPMIVRGIAHSLNHPYTLKAPVKLKSKVDVQDRKQLHDSLRHVGTDTRDFVTRQTRLQQEATDNLIENGGKVTSSFRKNVGDMYNIAVKDGNDTFNSQKSTLEHGVRQGLLTQSQANHDISSLATNETNKISSITSLQSKATNDNSLTTRQRTSLFSQANSYELQLTGEGSNKQAKILRAMSSNTSHITEKSYASIVNFENKSYKSASRSASKSVKSADSFARNLYETRSKAGDITSASASKAISKAIKSNSVAGSTQVTLAKSTSSQVVSHASGMAGKEAVHASMASSSVSSYNKSMASDNAKIASENARTWHTMASTVTSSLNSMFQHSFFELTHWFTKDANPNPKFKEGRHLKALRRWLNKPLATGTSDTQALHFANGNLPGLYQDENSVVNDGTGRELIKLPSGQLVYPTGRNVRTVLPKGTSVFSAEQSRKILGMVQGASHAYSRGTSVTSGAVLPLTDKNRAVRLMLDAMQYMHGDEDRQNSGSDGSLAVDALLRSNRTKDRQIKAILAKMSILIHAVEDKPVLTEAQIYKAGHRQALKRQQLRNLNNGNF